eukprot:1414007-Pyramimonas_sp.AAC.1
MGPHFWLTGVGETDPSFSSPLGFRAGGAPWRLLRTDAESFCSSHLFVRARGESLVRQRFVHDNNHGCAESPYGFPYGNQSRWRQGNQVLSSGPTYSLEGYYREGRCSM